MKRQVGFSVALILAGVVMPTIPDLWYVRLPSGRVVRTRSTKHLRHHVKSGRIPHAVQARRSPTQPWQPLNQIKELADLAPKKAKARPRVKAATSRTSGLRRIMDELSCAGDSSLHRAKLIASASAMLAICVALILGEWVIAIAPADWTWFATLIWATVLASIYSVCTSIVTKLTAIELSHFRASSFQEIRTQIVGNALRLTGAFALVGGPLVGAIIMLRALPGWVAMENGWLGMTMFIHFVRLILEVLCWSALGLTLLVAPIVVVEECSILQAIRQWFGLLRQQLGRVYCYQAIALAFALLLAGPILLSIGLALGGSSEWTPIHMLLGVALTPVLNYLLVAHVFVYLNLRYEFYYSARNR